MQIHPGFGFFRLVARLLLLLPLYVHAQEPLPPILTDSLVKPEKVQTLADALKRAEAEDTTHFTYHLQEDLNVAHYADDTLADDHWRIFDPARHPDRFDYANLGNNGSAARAMWFTLRPRLGFDLGHHAFDLYQAVPDSLRFYRNERAFTDVTYYQGRTQGEAAMRARFARTFAGGLNFSLEYRNINHLGQYQFQRNKHNAVQFGFWLPIGKRYQTLLTYGRNTHEQEENGGIPSDTLLGAGDFSGTLNLPIRFQNQLAGTRHANQTLRFGHYLVVAGKPGRSNLQFRHTATYRNATYKFAYKSPDSTAAILQPLFYKDERGLRSFIHTRELQNDVYAAFELAAGSNFKNTLDAGLRHSWIWLNQEPDTSTQQQVFGLGRLKTVFSDRFRLEGEAALGLLASLGEYRINAQSELNLGKVGAFSFSFLNQRVRPFVIQNKLYVSKQLVWEQDLQRPIETSLSATYQLPVAGLSAAGSTHQVNGFIYYDTVGFPRQTLAPVQVFQLSLREILHYRRFYLDNLIGVQRPNNRDILHLPVWMAKSSLTYRGYAFKRHALLDAGVLARINSATTWDAWQPVTSQFQLQSNREYASRLWVDVFFAMKVKRFRAFFSYENLSGLWQNKLVYTTDYYPQHAGQIRFGIGWRFSDANSGKADTSGVLPGATQSTRPF